MTDRRLAKTLRFADHACRDAAVICRRHARRALPEAAELLLEAAESAAVGGQAALVAMRGVGVRRRFSRHITRPMAGAWGWASSLAGEKFNLEMAAHVTRKLSLVLKLCGELAQANNSVDATGLQAAADRLGACYQRLSAAVQR